MVARVLLLAALSLAWAPVGAQDVEGMPEEAAPAPYQDAVFSEQELEEIEEAEALASGLADYDSAGLPRSVRVEVGVAQSNRGEQSITEAGVSVVGYWDSLDWGSWSLDAGLGTTRGDLLMQPPGMDLRAVGTLWQRGMHAGDGWQLDNGLGVLGTPMQPLARAQQRFSLPSTSFAGVSIEARQPQKGWAWSASSGRAGFYVGSRFPGYQLANGYVHSISAQWQPNATWSAALGAVASDGQVDFQALDASQTPTLAPAQNRAAHGVVQWHAADAWIRANVLSSQSAAPDTAMGAWLESEVLRGRYRHQAGVFYLEPGLVWGAQPISSDAQGAYYRLGYQYARWNVSGGLDHVRSVSGNGFDGWYGTGFARYQATTRWAYGMSGSVRASQERALAIQAFADHANRWGQTRWQAEWTEVGGPLGSTSREVSVDHAWDLKAGAELAAGADWGSTRFADGLDSTFWSVSATARQSIGDRLSLDATVRRVEGGGDIAVRSTNLNLGAAWELSPRWALTAQMYQNTGSERAPLVLDPLAPPGAFLPQPKDRTWFLAVRYQARAGQARGVLGGMPGEASGRLEGQVFLDKNKDGRRNAGEDVLRDVSVVLDGKYSVRTDAQGRFSFGRVAKGSHRLTVVPDNVPLPWVVPDAQAEQQVEVGLRDQVFVAIGAVLPE